jgi:maltose alpha-D-glucosyltransferase / alpha-amylase
VNVEAQSRDPHSILNWTRRMLAVRSRHPAFGRGTLTLLSPKNRKILAYLREYRGDVLLCVANVAHSPQAVELDLSRFVGRVPVELNAGTLFPPIGELTYLLTLPPYGFYWFALAPASDWPSWHTPAPEPLPEFITIVMRDTLAKALSPDGRVLIENESLPQYIAKRRWFGLKDQTIRSAHIANVTDIRDGDREILLAEVEVKTDAAPSRWFLPMSILWEDEPSGALPHRLALVRVRRGRRLGFLTDAFALPSFAYRLVDALAAGREFKNPEGVLHFQPTESGKELLRAAAHEDVNWLSAEQSNSSLTIGDTVMLKIFRRITAGQHPETEMSRYLTAQGFANAPPLLGDVVQVAHDGTPHTLAVALGFVRNQGDAWTWMLDQLTRALDSLSPNESEFDMLIDCEAVAAAIGRRLGEMHAVLARQTADEAFAPKVATAEDAAGWARKTEQRLDKAFSALEKVRDRTSEQDRDWVKALLSQRAGLTAAVNNLAKSGDGTLMIRIHGDFHLGQVLVASGDAYIIDFEGEPATSIAERRAKTSPLRDVAGLLRSMDYAGATLIEGKGVSTAPIDEAQRDRLIAEFRTRASRAFLKEYWAAGHFGGGAAERTLLELFLIEKAAYEVIYEAANRPTWLTVPVGGLSRLVKRIVDRDAGGSRG